MMTEDYRPAYLSTSDERGSRMAEFIEDCIRDLHELRVLDIGCRLGGISLAFARRSRQVVGIDIIIDDKREQSWKEKKQERNQAGFDHNLHFMLGNGLALPFEDNAFDVILVNGVLEWVGSVERPQNPRDMQVNFMKEVRRCLNPSGFFYLAIENRFFPGYIHKDSHTNLPFVNALPRKLADHLARLYKKHSFRTYTYTYWGLLKLLKEANFTHVSCYTPLDTYWFPYAIVPIADRRKILRALDHPNLADSTSSYRQAALVTGAQRAFIYTIAWMGLTKAFSNAFVMVGFK